MADSAPSSVAVLTSAISLKSAQTSMSPAALCSAVAHASLRSFLFMLALQSRGLGPKEMPPPGMSGERLEPRRALPEPFCLYGLRPPPRTSPRVMVLALPCRALRCTCTR